MYVPSLCVVAQGAKEVVVGGEAYRYDPAQSLLVSVDMPALTHVAEATPDRPCLAVRIPIDPAVVGELLADGSAIPPPGPPVRGLGVIDRSNRHSSTRSAASWPCSTPRGDRGRSRRSCSGRSPSGVLTGPQGARLRQIAAAGAPAQRIARAIRWLRDHFAEPLRVEALASTWG